MGEGATRDYWYGLKWLGISFIRALLPVVEHLRPRQPDARDPAFHASFQPTNPPSRRALAMHVYLPSKHPESADKKLPIFVSLQSAGFVLHLLGSNRVFCSWLADAVPCVVVDADYRKGPEDPWPAAVNDVGDAIKRTKALAAEHGWDADRIAVGGFSSGGCLALVEAATNPNLKACVAFYPSTRLDQSAYDKPKVSSPSKGNAGSDVPPSIRRLFYSAYIPAATVKNRADPRISPIYADPAGFPPSVTIVTGELDSLAAEGEAMADRLNKARPGICKYYCARGQGHAWDLAAKLETEGSRIRFEAWELAASRLRDAFG